MYTAYLNLRYNCNVLIIIHLQFEYQQAQLELEIENLSWKVERASITDRAVSHV